MAYGNPQRLYVFESDAGVIKAGITSLAGEQRIKQHAQRVPVLRYFITEQYVNGFAAEAAFLARLSAIGRVIRGREWFAGVDYEDAVRHAREIAAEFVNTNPESKSHLLRTTRALLRFNDSEIAILDAYCAKFGLERSTACRQLLLEVVDMEHQKILPAWRPETA